MNIKSLLLGSAAVLIAASTAQAADAIVVEPEPVEYVRICDAYGSGFFYIPGTETCMNINGFIRSTYRHYTFEDGAGNQTEADQAIFTYRGRLNIDVRNETDWGTLRSQLRLQGGDYGSSGGGDANVGVDRALISVAGFRLGYSDNYWITGTQYGQGPAVNDGPYNYDQAIFFDYTYAADGFSLTFGVQDTQGTADGAATTNTAENLDYYVGGKYVADWGWAAATYIYDQNATNFGTGLMTGADAWKVAVEFTNIGDSGWNVGGWYMTDGDDDTSYVNGIGNGHARPGAANAANTVMTDSQWGVQANGPLADNLVGYAAYYSSSADANASAAANLLNKGGIHDGSDAFAVGLVWTPIVGLSIQTEYYAYQSDTSNNIAVDEVDYDEFLVRITRSW